MEKLATAFGIYIAICGFVWLVFVRLEPLLKKDTRDQIANWVSGSKHGDADNRWPATFGVVFDRVFTEKHLSWRCFWRSCVASYLAVVVMTAVLYMVNSSVREIFDGMRLQPLLGLGALAGILNLFPDYLSLLETRLVLRRMAKGSAGAFRLFGWLIFDAVVTAGIFTAALLAFVLAFGGDVKDLVEGISNALLSLFGGTASGDFVGIFLYSTFFTSVWVWLYVFAGIAVRLIYRAKRIQSFVDKHLDVATRPLSVMGVVLIVVFTIAYWPAIAMVG